MLQTVFQRYEKKYLINFKQYQALSKLLDGSFVPDQFGTYNISNVYYDTDSYDLIRASIEKPVYKEKLRMRSYGKATESAPVFLELKKKFDGVVYKRRVTLTYADAKQFVATGRCIDESSQIQREIQSFLSKYPVSEKVYLYYERTALKGVENDDLRITFDSDIRFRRSELRLDNGTWGTDLLPAGTILMEIKTPGVMPLWLSRGLSQLEIYPSTFSKYGACYQEFILKDFLRRDISA